MHVATETVQAANSKESRSVPGLFSRVLHYFRTCNRTVPIQRNLKVTTNLLLCNYSENVNLQEIIRKSL